MMAKGTSTISVDLLNPGQVFGCLGLAEASDVLFGGATAGFDWQDDEATFTVQADHDAPVAGVVNFLGRADVTARSPALADLDTEKWSVPTEGIPPESGWPYAPPSSPAPLPVVLRSGNQELVLDHWGDTTRRDNTKFWAGAAGYPAAARVRDALELVRASVAGFTEDPFSLAAPQKSALGFDWRRDYVPLGIGFSVNEHSGMAPRGYPLVEILAAVGLTHARPQRPEPGYKLHYRYAVARGTLPLPLLRAVLGVARLPLQLRVFCIKLGWPGRENQARCITDVHEENTHVDR